MKIRYIFILLTILSIIEMADAATIIVDDSGGADYTKIQDAINAANGGDTIEVRSGTYYENVNVYKRLNLKGVNTGGGRPIINSTQDGNSVTLNADGTIIEGFIILSRCESYQWCGIGIFVDSNNNVIRYNIVNSRRGHGIQLWTSNNNLVKNNTANSNYEVGIILSESHLNTIDNNIVIGNNNSIHGHGIRLGKSNNNIIKNNRANYNYESGITIVESSFNTVENNIANYNDGIGIALYNNSHDNTFTDNTANYNDVNGINTYTYSYDNDFIHNTASYNGAHGIHSHYYSYGNTYRNNVINHNNASGIMIHDNSGDNTLDNNIITYNKDNGIDLQSIDHNTVTRNTINYNDRGIRIIGGGRYNTITDNNVNNNNQSGIVINQGDHNTIERNIAKGNSCGISICHFSNNNVIKNNSLNLNNAGILIATSSNNILTNNSAINNIGPPKNDRPLYTGISLIRSNKNILNNSIVSNGKYGIILNSSNGNKIYNNYFNNTQNVLLKGTNNNIWNITKALGKNIIKEPYLGGNFWANLSGKGFSQTCQDSNNDGICNLPYILNSNNKDYLPLKYRDFKPPASITGLKNITYKPTFINWTWIDPKDIDFAKVMVYINGIFKTNVTKGRQYYNSTGLIPNTWYKISTHTVDTSGNINKTWVNKTAKTK